MTRSSDLDFIDWLRQFFYAAWRRQETKFPILVKGGRPCRVPRRILGSLASEIQRIQGDSPLIRIQDPPLTKYPASPVRTICQHVGLVETTQQGKARGR